MQKRSICSYKYCILWLLFILLFFIGDKGISAKAQVKNVPILNSYQKNLSWTDNQTEGISGNSFIITTTRIPLYKLPGGSKIINNLLEFFQSHKSIAITTAIIILMLIMFIFVLLFYLEKINKMKEDLILKNRELSGLYDQIATANETLKQQFEELIKAQKEIKKTNDALEQCVAERARKFEEKTEMCLTRANVNQIIGLIKNGDLEAINVAENIVSMLGVNLNNDIVKVETALKSITYEIIKAVFEKHKWLDKFLSSSELENMNFSGCSTLEMSGSVFKKNIYKIASTINVLICSNNGSEIINQVCEYVLLNVDSQISLGVVADNMFMNKTYISELFKQKTGIGFVEYLKTVKMIRAKRLLKDGSLKIYEIAERLGYKDIEYFSRQFKKYCKVTPGEYRQNSAEIDKKLQ